MSLRLTEILMKSMKVGRAFNEFTFEKPVNSLDFSDDGCNLVAADDGSLRIYNAVSGEYGDILVKAAKIGVDLVRYTHHTDGVIHASKNGGNDDSIRYLSLHEHRYIRYFRGHRGPVVSLCVCPTGDQFLSSSQDGTLRLWDLRTQAGQGLLRVSCPRPVAAYDPTGQVFGVLTSPTVLRLYDVRSYDRGPFSSFQIAPDAFDPPGVAIEAACLKFSPDGKYMLLPTRHHGILLLDAFTGSKLRTLRDHYPPDHTLRPSPTAPLLEASFSPDSQFIASGAADGRVLVWSAERGVPVAIWQPPALPAEGPLPATALRWNPRKAMLATGCGPLCFWIPDGARMAEAADAAGVALPPMPFGYPAPGPPPAPAGGPGYPTGPGGPYDPAAQAPPYGGPGYR
ncbi:putative histone H3 methyltransferase complex and RNA cleavage factor II complex; subunit SWD2 [Paratrimastix pyriformis]|uniref:Histone H3 methyltransferase complex and RNA cleavage factor II complex n=1 Tax=Paratrimastix pyriformis TaxID=342808 RepID=A0ABQ8UNM3_9EUKA|nr:putative histone H3 methyltransferase complex and RNA cleavage factor II complex; subunit SWD2 [Paratrimastix pyriformis]